MVHSLARLMPWYGGPDWPSPQELSIGWLLVALIVTVSATLCWIEFGAWRFGSCRCRSKQQHAFSATD